MACRLCLSLALQANLATIACGASQGHDRATRQWEENWNWMACRLCLSLALQASLATDTLTYDAVVQLTSGKSAQ
jgi:hypothetical protein